MRDDKEIQETISKIEEKLADQRFKPLISDTAKEGYLKSVEILKEKQTDITRAGLEELKTVQGRAIAALAIDYLNGECEQNVLLRVPIKDK